MFFIGLEFIHNMFLGSKPNRKTLLFIGGTLNSQKKKKKLEMEKMKKERINKTITDKM